MILKKLNVAIVAASIALNFIIVLYCAMLLSDFVWWIFTPASQGVYLAHVNTSYYNNSSKYIVNRYPFGVITRIESTTAVPQAMSSIKLIGIYFNPPQDSMAFVEYKNSIKNAQNAPNNSRRDTNDDKATSVVVKSGDSIVGDVVVQKINIDNIVIAQGDTTGVLKISGESVSLANHMNSYDSQPNNLNRTHNRVMMNNLNNDTDDQNENKTPVNQLLNRYKNLPLQQRNKMINDFLANQNNNN